MTWSMELQLHRGLPDSAFYCGWNFRTKHQVDDFLFLFSRKTSYWILLGTCIATPNSSPGKKFLTDEACSIVNILLEKWHFWSPGYHFILNSVPEKQKSNWIPNFPPITHCPK
jgi:hypothetical protein